jgi:hypothetical protein
VPDILKQRECAVSVGRAERSVHLLAQAPEERGEFASRRLLSRERADRVGQRAVEVDKRGAGLARVRPVLEARVGDKFFAEAPEPLEYPVERLGVAHGARVGRDVGGVEVLFVRVGGKRVESLSVLLDRLRAVA